jgi:hypothetical protein
MRLIMRNLLASMFFASAIFPASAHYHHAPRCYPTESGLVVKGSQYQQPNGTYDALSDLVRDVNGTPCGIDCPAPSLVYMATPPAYYCAPY